MFFEIIEKSVTHLHLRGNWSPWLKQQLPGRERTVGGRHQSFVPTHHKGNRIVIQAGKLFHHWAEVTVWIDLLLLAIMKPETKSKCLYNSQVLGERMMVIMRENEAIRTEVSWGNLNLSKFDEIIWNLPSIIGLYLLLLWWSFPLHQIVIDHLLHMSERVIYFNNQKRIFLTGHKWRDKTERAFDRGWRGRLLRWMYCKPYRKGLPYSYPSLCCYFVVRNNCLHERNIQISSQTGQIKLTP